MLVPAAKVLDLIQRTMCLVGNASECISQSRRARILGAIDPTWSKFGSEDFPKARETFGEQFQTKLTSKVEKETALAKAVLITKRHKKESHSTRKPGQKSDNFFRRSPAARYGGRQGKSFFRTGTKAFGPTGKENNPESNQDQARGHCSTNQALSKPNRKGFKIATLLNTQRVRSSRNKVELNCRKRKRPASWGTNQILPPKLASDNKRPLGVANGVGSSTGAEGHTKTGIRTAKASLGFREKQSIGRRARQIEVQRSNITSKRKIRKFSQPNVPGAKSRWVLETCHKPAITKSVCDISPFQDGGDKVYSERTTGW